MQKNTKDPNITFLTFFTSPEKTIIEFLLWSIKFPTYVSVYFELQKSIENTITFQIDNLNIDYKNNENQIEVESSVLDSAKESLGYFENTQKFFQYLLTLTNTQKYFPNYVLI